MSNTLPPFSQKTPRRFTHIDFLKGILTIGMIIAHSIQFTSMIESHPAFEIQAMVNLVSFSGFIFSFGFVSWSVYYNREKLPKKSVFINSSKCYVAFVLSALAFKLLLEHTQLNWNLFWNITLIQMLPPYSEFLIAFSGISILFSVISPLVKFITKSGIFVIIYCIGCCIITSVNVKLIEYLLPSSLQTLCSVFLGGPFPVIPYSVLYIIGIYMARREEDLHIFFVFLSTMSVALFLINTGMLDYYLPNPGFAHHLVSLLTTETLTPRRFSPDWRWIMYSLSIVYLYYLTCKLIDSSITTLISNQIRKIGRNVLLYLLISNISLFILKYCQIINDLKSTGLSMLVIFIVLFTQYIEFLVPKK